MKTYQWRYSISSLMKNGFYLSFYLQMFLWCFFYLWCELLQRFPASFILYVYELWLLSCSALSGDNTYYWFCWSQIIWKHTVNESLSFYFLGGIWELSVGFCFVEVTGNYTLPHVDWFLFYYLPGIILQRMLIYMVDTIMRESWSTLI